VTQAHLDKDIWNVDAKHIVKSAGTTPEERSAFGKLLDAGFTDTFRHFHPDAEHCYSYWSVRARNGCALNPLLANCGCGCGWCGG
jgi:exonuclease III